MPSSGSIGLGTQTGQIGVVRTHAASSGVRMDGSVWFLVIGLMAVAVAVGGGWM